MLEDEVTSEETSVVEKVPYEKFKCFIVNIPLIG